MHSDRSAMRIVPGEAATSELGDSEAPKFNPQDLGWTMDMFEIFVIEKKQSLVFRPIHRPANDGHPYPRPSAAA